MEIVLLGFKIIAASYDYQRSSETDCNKTYCLLKFLLWSRVKGETIFL
jgi:hypothetical protein